MSRHSVELHHEFYKLHEPLLSEWKSVQKKQKSADLTKFVPSSNGNGKYTPSNQNGNGVNKLSNGNGSPQQS